MGYSIKINSLPKERLGMDWSESMVGYQKRLNIGLDAAYSVAKSARSRGLDPRTEVEIPVATDLADRVEALLGIKGISARIRELEATISREEVALRIGDDFVARRFGSTSTVETLDHAIRTAMAILTEGVVAAPTEGIAKVSLGKNDDGTEYLKIFYAGPIRSAGGTAQALSVLVGDYVRRGLGLAAYKPRDEEVERYIEEIKQYNTVTKLQYLPNDDEIRLIVRNCPVCVDGEGTEKAEVSGYRDLARVETNAIRGGMALVIGEGIALKAPKVQKHVKKLGLDGWDWLDTFVAGAMPAGSDEKVSIKPKYKYLDDLIGGRPVFAYPMRKGGFRLRYGRSRNTGYAAAGLNPATMHILGDFLAVGTQMKIERPGKAAGIVPVDSIEGPTVRLKGGEVRRVDDPKSAKEISGNVECILDVGELLISFGEFLENNHPLVPSVYCHEWWSQECEGEQPETEEAALALTKNGGYLHPDYTYLWDDLTIEQIQSLHSFVSEKGKLEGNTLILPYERDIKEIIEEILLPHTISVDKICISNYIVFLECLGLNGNLNQRRSLPPTSESDPLLYITELSGIKLRSKSGTRIGGRMGRPGKSRPRKMNPPPHVLFPLGEAGGSRRSFQEAKTFTTNVLKDGGTLTIQTGRRRCPSCGKITFRNLCDCNSHTDPVFSCQKCGREGRGETCDLCGIPLSSSQNLIFNLKSEYLSIMEKLGFREEMVPLVKGVKGLTSREKAVEDISKGILRAKHEVYVFKDGTVRYDMIDLPLTHFTPKETGVRVETLLNLGYEVDTDGVPLTHEDQVLELRTQDILLSDHCAEYLIQVAHFIDELLEKVYSLPPFYNVENRDDLLGHLVIGLAPHTSAGVLSRIIGFCTANVGYAHPFFHAAKRRNCFFGDTEIEVYDGSVWKKIQIRRFVLENFDLARPGLDRLGTYYSDPVRPYYTRTVDTGGIVHIRRITSVSVHKAPEGLYRFETGRGNVLIVTPDHAMLVWDLSYLRKVRAIEVNEGDSVPVFVGNAVISDRIKKREIVPATEERVFCLTVAEEHTVLANGVFTGQCDGDEDCIMLLLDGLLNFSRAFLPETRGGLMDAPLVLTTRIDPKEIDKESHNIDVCRFYPLELYKKALLYAHPKDVEALIDRVDHRLGKPESVEGFSYTHETSDISLGPKESMYTQMESMLEKLEAELSLAEKIRAVDVDDVAERVLNTHFIRDLMGNLSAFSKQKFRCSKCNTSYRRVPLAGKCSKCNGNIIPTVHEGSVKKYLEMSRDICTKYKVSLYTKQRVEVILLAIESTFGQPKEQQLGLADFM